MEDYTARHEGDTGYQEDPTYLAVAKAKGHISRIGKRLLVPLAHEQLDEYDRFASVRPDSVPDDLRDTLHAHYTERTEELGERKGSAPHGLEREINAYLADFNAMLEDHAERGKIMEIFTDAQTADMFTNAVRILESQQTGRWQVMATAMRALLDPSIPMSEFVKKVTATAPAKIDTELETTLEKHRESFLIDRLLNYVHNTGTMSARVSNYFPRAASLLLAHSLPGHDDYLLYHSSLLYGNDTLSKQIRQGVSSDGTSGLVEDLISAMQQKSMPREYKYAVLLEFADERLHEAVQATTNEDITPSRAYTLLQRISHHDGHSKGRLKKVA